MKNTKKLPAIAEAPPLHGGQATCPPETPRLWHRLPTFLKIALMLPLVMALLGAEIELHLAPQIDAVLTAAGVWAVWAWLAGGPG